MLNNSLADNSSLENGRPEPNITALLPILIFLIIYLGSGLYYEYIHPIEGKMGFYITSVVVSFGIALITAFMQNRKLSFDEKINVCAKGIGNTSVTIMLLIFLLAGAFSGIATAAGGAINTANLLLSIIPADFSLVGIFLIACVISMSMGTSVGTISMLAPIALIIANNSGISVPLCAATVIGGAMFGDNLSFISDTTIVATKTQGVAMKEKFLANIKIALPAAVITVVVLIGISIHSEINLTDNLDFNFLLTLPYFLVFGLALAGINVFLVLLIGIILFIIFGVCFDAVSYATAFEAMGNGTSSMFETMIVSILVASISALVKQHGGFEAILEYIRKHFNSKKGGMLGIALLTSFMDVATANNTVAIFAAAPIAKDISKEYGVTGRITASLMDTCSCIVQGIIPYGAQLLVAASIMGISSISIMPYLFYQFILTLFVAIVIIRAR
jgi:Na+/H+ antiporter NhaC